MANDILEPTTALPSQQPTTTRLGYVPNVANNGTVLVQLTHYRGHLWPTVQHSDTAVDGAII